VAQRWPGDRLFAVMLFRLVLRLIGLPALLLLLAAPAPGQTPTIGIIDFYGLRHVSEEQARQALSIKVGDDLPDSPTAAQHRLEALPGVLHARLNAVCCDAGKAIIFVGIEEKGSPRSRLRRAPKGKVGLRADVIAAGKESENALMDAVSKGDTLEDDSQGHALMHNPALRAVQERFIVYAARDLRNLRDVLRNSADAGQRALAAEVLGYATDKRAVVPDLEYAMSDVDDGARNNAMRALGVIAGFARKKPELGIVIHAHPFVNLLNSLVWTDRNKASLTLMFLTESRDPALLADLHDHALPALIEMARWKSAGHAEPAFMILGRIGGLSEKAIHDALERGDRETVIARSKE
jgi:hypothetical protein